MKTALTTYAVICACFACGATDARDSLSDDDVLRIRFEQKLNGQIDPSLRFRDESGSPVKLKELFGRRPIILVLGYYGCPMLCSLTLNGLIETMQDLKLDAGKEFDVVSVSIDPKEKPALAAAKKRTYLKLYGRHGTDRGWHFLTGEEEESRELAGEAGFHYAYDARSRQFAHPAGILVLTPDGRISRYLLGVTFSASELDSALRDAAVRRTGSPVERLVLLCFHYNPITGRFGKLLIMAVRVCGVATLLGLVFVVFRLRPNHRKAMAEAPV